MTFWEKLFRALKLIFGWAIVVLFTTVFLAMAFDGEEEPGGMLITFLFLDLLGALLLLSARKDKKHAREAQRQKNAPVFLSVTCPHCGAGNRIEKGRPATCEYCGSPIGENHGSRT